MRTSRFALVLPYGLVAPVFAPSDCETRITNSQVAPFVGRGVACVVACVARTARALEIVIAALCLVSCGGGGGGGDSTPAPPAPPANTYPIGGSVSGLRGTGLVLQNNGGDPLTVAANGSFTFATALASNASYAVTVRTQPTASPAELCSVASGNGAVGSAAVANVAVTCHTATGKYLYTANSLNKVSGFSIDSATGALTEIPGSPFSINGYQPRGVFIDKTGKFLFVTGSVAISDGPSSLTGYTIDSATGALTPIPGMPITTPLYYGGAFFHPNDRVLYLPAFLFVSSITYTNVDNGLYAYSIDATTGALTTLPGSPYRFPQDTAPRIGAFNPAGTTVFVPSGSLTNSNAVRVNAFAADATTGALTPQGSADFGFPVNEIAVHPGGKFAYLRLSTGQLGMLDIQNPASLVATIAPVSAGFGAGSVFDASGEYAYFLYNGLFVSGSTLVPGPGSVFGYRIDTASGNLTALAGSPYATGGSQVGALAIDPTRRYVVATNFASGTVAAFEIETAAGVLHPVPGSPFTPTVGTVPLAVTFDPSGRFAYLPDATSYSVSAYSIDSANGQLVFVGSYPVGASPIAFARIAGLK